jgi:predicted SAM-dependent methyltransferase
MEITHLEIGSGRRPHKGFFSVDIEPNSGANIVGDFRKMNFENVEVIRAHHLLEHFSRDESLVVLSQWRDWLKVGGLLIVETPDFEYICKGFADLDNGGKYWFTRHAYGSQEADWAFHRDGWYESKFLSTLPELGYEVISVERNITRRILPNIVVTAKKTTFK